MSDWMQFLNDHRKSIQLAVNLPMIALQDP